METTSPEPAEGNLSTIVEGLPQVPEDYSVLEEHQPDPPSLQPVDMELEEPVGHDAVESNNKSLMSEFDDYDGEAVQNLPQVESNGQASAAEIEPAPLDAIASDIPFSELMQPEPTPTKRSLRVKTRKRVYQEEKSEAGMSSEEEYLFPRGNSRDYSDDEYVPVSERKSKFKKSRDDDEFGGEEDEEDEEIVEDFPKRRRKRKKPGEQKSASKTEKKPPAKKGKGRKAKPESEVSQPVAVESAPADSTEVIPENSSHNKATISVEPVTLDSDSDIENCLSASKIKVEDKDKVKIQLFGVNSKDSITDVLESKSKKGEDPSSEMGKAFENFLVSNSEIKIKKLSKKAKESTTPLEIPTIEPPELIKLIDSWTQTEVANLKTSEMQTTSPYAMRMSKNLPLSSAQAENACQFMKNVLTLTTDLGTLMCKKSEEFIEKKINTDYIKDTTKVAFCKEKTSLLFKLAKDNLTKIEEMLEKNYEEYININKLEAAVEIDKTLKANQRDNDSDCEIVEVKEEPKKKKFNANTVFLNKELSIKIAKKPPVEVRTTPAGKQLKMSGREGHAVWINKSIMVKKVKPNQSFLAKDGRFEKPPDNRIEEIVQNFFENHDKIKAYCQHFTTTEWLFENRNQEVVCNYFVIEEPPKCSNNLVMSSGSEDDGFFDSPGSNENVPVLNDQYDVVGAPDVKPLPLPSLQEPEPLVTICIQYLHNLLYKPRIGESLEAANNIDENKKPEKLFALCVEQLERIIKPQDEHLSQEMKMKQTDVAPKIEMCPDKLSLICLKLLCKYSEMSLNGVNNIKPSIDKVNTSLQKSIHHQISLRMICFQRIVSLMYNNKSKKEINLPKSLGTFTSGVENKVDSKVPPSKELNNEYIHCLMPLQTENTVIYDDLPSQKIQSLKFLTMDAVNLMLEFISNKVQSAPAIITDVRQINDFNESDEGSECDESEFPTEDCAEYYDAPPNNWLGKIQVQELKHSMLNMIHTQPNEGEPISGGFTLKIEPIDNEENETDILDPIAIKLEHDVPRNDSMVVIPKTELPNNVDNENNTVQTILSHLTEDFLDNQFELIMRQNKLMLQDSLRAENPFDAVFSQSQQRIRREFEPDSDPENDEMGLLTVQSFRDVNVQPASKAKGTLLESSSEEENNKVEAPAKKKRGRPRKNKNQGKTTVPIVLPMTIAEPVTSEPPEPTSTDKVQNPIEILTRRMRDRIRNEEKQKQKDSSTDSENEILYSFNANSDTNDNSATQNISSMSKNPEPEPIPDKRSLRNKVPEVRRTLRSRNKEDLANDKVTKLAEDVVNETSKSPDFSGFPTTKESEIESYRIWYGDDINDKCVIEENTAKEAEENASREAEENLVSNSRKKSKSSKRNDILNNMDKESLDMLSPQVDIVIDESKTVDLESSDHTVKQKHKKITEETVVENSAEVINSPEDLEPFVNQEGEGQTTSLQNLEPVESEVVSSFTTPEKVSTETQIIKNETTEWELRDGWKCFKISNEDSKLYQMCYVPMDKLPETFVQTYFEFVQLSRTGALDKDPEIERLTNLKSLHRAPNCREEGAKRAPRDDTRQRPAGSREASDQDEHDYTELDPSDDEADPSGTVEGTETSDTENHPVVKIENTLAKDALLGDGASDSEASAGDEPPSKLQDGAKFMTGPKSKRRLVEAKVPAHPDSLVLTADKMMKKELDYLHAPVVIGEDKVSPNKPQVKTSQKSQRTGGGTRGKGKSDVDSDASSEEEKQWITTKEKLLKRLQKKHKDQLQIDDDKRVRLVNTYIEKKSDETTNSYSQIVLQQRRRRKPKKKTRKQKEKELRMLSMELQQGLVMDGELIDMNLPIHGRAGAGGTAYRGGRRNIRKVIDKKSLARSTVIANMDEFERKKRLGLTHLRLCKHLNCESSVKAVVIDKRLCLEYDFDSNRAVVNVHQAFTKVMKVHQYEGVKFMWDASFETLDRIDSGHAGGGCILAHCMGLGKTLQVLALLHTVMTHAQVGVRRVLVCCPLSTVLNWVDEIHKWMGPVTNKIKVFELSKLKKTYERAYQLEDWYTGGGIFIIGYELFRSLTTLHPYLDDVRPTIISKINSALLDPGPDIVVCDEGHLLKNDCSGLAVAMNRVKTSRRIVLTGTPMQNNLREYYCMVNFVKPNLLGTYSEFSNRFENPIMNGQHRDSSEDDIRLMKARSHILHKVLEGCLQRQEASVLYPYLPKKSEYTLFVSLSKCQSDLYKHYLDNLARQNKQSILKDFHILQKIWTHPQVLHNYQLKSRDDVAKDEIKMEDDLGKEELCSEEMKTAGAGGEVWWTQYLGGGHMLDALASSHKFQVVFRILDECVRVGDKLLIFSTSLLTMDSLEYFLKSIKQWSLGHDYYRLDGSVPPEVRQKWCREFNSEHNTNTRLFLLSTRAGCLGLNMTAANRVIILDTSWNPAHDIQSIFRVYRFGQKKDCHVYRLVSMGTMEQKIYERSVTKQAVACRVVDEQQIERHYNMAELTELYRFEETDTSLPPVVAAGDELLLRVARALPAVRAVHEHDSLLRDSCEQQLPEHERDAAWAQFQQEQAHTPGKSYGVKRKKKQPANEQEHCLPSIELQLPILPASERLYSMSQAVQERTSQFPEPPYTQAHTPMPPNAQVKFPTTNLSIPIQNKRLAAEKQWDSPRKRGLRRSRRRRLESDSSTDTAPSAGQGRPDDNADDSDDDKQSLAALRQVQRPTRNNPRVEAIKVYSGKPPTPDTPVEDAIELSDTEQPTAPVPPKPVPGSKLFFKKPPSNFNAPKEQPLPSKAPDTDKVPLHPSLLQNPYFLKIVAHTYRSWNPNLEDSAAATAAEYSAKMLLKKKTEILSGTLYEIAVKTLGIQTMKVLWQNYQSIAAQTEGAAPLSIPTQPAPPVETRRVEPLKLKLTPAKASIIPPQPKVSTLKLREASTLLKTPEPGPASRLSVEHPQPVSLHIGAHPSSSVPRQHQQNETVDLSDDVEGEEESILPDDDVPRIGTVSPPPAAAPPPLPAPSVRTARKKTTPHSYTRSVVSPLQPDERFQVISVPQGQSLLGTRSLPPSKAPQRITLIRKQTLTPTHVIGADNKIVPISVVEKPAEAPPIIPTAPTMSNDVPICLDSDDDDVTAIVPDSEPSNRAPAPPPNVSRGNNFNPSMLQVGNSQTVGLSARSVGQISQIVGQISNDRGQMPQPNVQMTQPFGQSMQPVMQMPNPNVQIAQPISQNQNPQVINISEMMASNAVQPKLMLDLNSIIQRGTKMGNIILVPASAFQSGASEPGPPPAPIHVAPVPVKATPAAPTPATPVPACPDPAVSQKRPRGRPRKVANTGDKLIFHASGALTMYPPAPPQSSHPGRGQAHDVDTPMRPEKPPSVPQEPTSTTGDEPSSTVDLTERRGRKRRGRSSSSSSSASSSSSSSQSSRDSSPDPLSLFRNVVQIKANYYGNKRGSVKGKNVTGVDNVLITDDNPAAWVNHTVRTLETSSGKPDQSTSRPMLSTSGNSSKNKKSSLTAKASTASWQTPKSLVKKPSETTPKTTAGEPAKTASSKKTINEKAGTKSTSQDSVDLTEAENEAKGKGKHKFTGPERVLGTVDLTDEPRAKKPTDDSKASSNAVSRPAAINRSAGVTSTQGAKNITLTNTGAITFTARTGAKESKPKVVTVTSIKSEAKASPRGAVVADKRKSAASAAGASKKSKSSRSTPMSLEEFTIDDIMDDIIELE